MDRLIQNNTILRIIALVLACVMWLAVGGPGGDTNPNSIAEKFPFPVHIYVDGDEVVTNISSPTGVVVVNGSMVNVSSLPAQMLNVSLVANARGLSPGTHTIRLAAVNIPPVNYTIQPAEVQIHIEKRVAIQKPVRIIVSGIPASGYTAGTATADIQNAKVSGAMQAIAKVAAVEAAVTIQGTTRDLTKLATLTPVAGNGQPIAGVRVNPETVTVNIPITAPKIVTNIMPQVLGSTAPGYAVSGIVINPPSAVLFGTLNSSQQNPIMNLPIDVSGLRKSETRRVPIPLPQGTTEADPSVVQVTIQVEASMSRVLQGVPIQIQNQNAGNIHLGQTKVNVTVSGPKSLIRRLTMGDVYAYVDATHLTTGSKVAPINIVVPDWIRVTEITMNEVPVKVDTSTPK